MKLFKQTTNQSLGRFACWSVRSVLDLLRCRDSFTSSLRFLVLFPCKLNSPLTHFTTSLCSLEAIEDMVIICLSLPFLQVIHQLNKLKPSGSNYYLWSRMNLSCCMDEDEHAVAARVVIYYVASIMNRVCQIQLVWNGLDCNKLVSDLISNSVWDSLFMHLVKYF